MTINTGVFMNKDYLGPIPETRSTFHFPESGEEDVYFFFL